MISRTVKGEEMYYLHNGHGDVVALTDVFGLVVGAYEYDAFGVPKPLVNEKNNPYRYAGYEYDEETALYYLKSRFYDAELARFISRDTYAGKGEDPLSLNRYAYCANEPLKYHDPSGKFYSTTRVSYKDGTRLLSTDISRDILKLQIQLVLRNHLSIDAVMDDWGFYSYATMKAVNSYKDAVGLNNWGKNAGVVGQTTWTSLGLPIASGNTISAYNNPLEHRIGVASAQISLGNSLNGLKSLQERTYGYYYNNYLKNAVKNKVNLDGLISFIGFTEAAGKGFYDAYKVSGATYVTLVSGSVNTFYNLLEPTPGVSDFLKALVGNKYDAQIKIYATRLERLFRYPAYWVMKTPTTILEPGASKYEEDRNSYLRMIASSVYSFNNNPQKWNFSGLNGGKIKISFRNYMADVMYYTINTSAGSTLYHSIVG